MQAQNQWIHELHRAAEAGDQTTVWMSIRRIAACEVRLLDFGDDFYLREDFAADIASHLVFDRGLVHHWTTKTPNEIWVYIKMVVAKFVWEHCQKHRSIEQALSCQNTLIGGSGLRFTMLRLRALVRTGQLFLLYKLFDGVPRSDDIQALIRYLVSTMDSVMKSSPAHILLRAYVSLNRVLRREEGRHSRGKT